MPVRASGGHGHARHARGGVASSRSLNGPSFKLSFHGPASPRRGACGGSRSRWRRSIDLVSPVLARCRIATRREALTAGCGCRPGGWPGERLATQPRRQQHPPRPSQAGGWEREGRRPDPACLLHEIASYSCDPACLLHALPRAGGGCRCSSLREPPLRRRRRRPPRGLRGSTCLLMYVIKSCEARRAC